MPQLLLAEKNFEADILSFEKIRNDDMMIEALDLYDIILIYDDVNGSIDAFIRSLHFSLRSYAGENGYRIIQACMGGKFCLCALNLMVN